VARRLLIVPLVVLVLAAGWLVAPDWYERAGWCGPRTPDRIGAYTRSAETAASRDQLSLDPWTHAEPVVVETTPLGFCPSWSGVEGALPMRIWFRGGDGLFVAYYRGGGP
jgi:hypothetical protein